MLFRTSIKCPPREEPEETDRARGDESSAPTEPDRYDGNDERCNERSDIGAGVEDSGGERALFFRKPFGDCFDRGRKVSRLAKTEEEARDAKAKHRTRERMAHRRKAPEDDGE